MVTSLRQFAARFSALFRKPRLEQELKDELCSHLDMLVEENVCRGMSREEARYTALRSFGGVDQAKEIYRDQRGIRMFETLMQDIHYAARILRKGPGFTAIAVLSLALGIGANASIFTLINGVLLKSLPVREPRQLVSFGVADNDGAVDGIAPGPLDLFPYEFYKQIEDQNPFQGLTAFGSFPVRVSVRQGGDSAAPAEQISSQLVSGNHFSVLGVNAILGRTINPSDAGAPGREPVAVISYRYWQRMFSGNRAVIGKAITVNGTPFNVIGVAPPGFFGVILEQDPPDMWMPLTMQQQVTLSNSLLGPQGLYWLHIMGRGNPEMNLKQMQEWVNLRLRQYMTEREGPQLSADRRNEIQKIFVELLPGGRGTSHLRGEYAQPLLILMGVVALVLIIACANLAILLLAKTAGRQKEISTRLALGASGSRIIRQMLTEAGLLSAAGGGAGLVFAVWGTNALIKLVAVGSQYTPLSANPDMRVLGFTLGVSLLTGLLFGIAPALRVSRVNLAPDLKAGSRNITGGGRPGRRFLPRILMASQVALSILLLVSAGLFVRTLRNLQKQDFGFARSNVLLVSIDPRTASYKPEQVGSLYFQIIDRVMKLPSVRSASISGIPPISHSSWISPISIRGKAPQPERDRRTSVNGVGPRYFETVGIPLVAGRSIGPQDTMASPEAAVLSQSAAKYFFPHGDAIGQHFSVDDPGVKGDWEIVGIVKDAKYNSPREESIRMLYLAALQLRGSDAFASSLEVRTSGDPANVAKDVRRALTEVDSNLPILDVNTLNQFVEDNFLSQEELISRLSGFFALLALLLACIGLYGGLPHNVVRRTNEIGIRVALGARQNSVLWMVLKESLFLLAIGVGAGIPITLAATRLVRSQLFGLTPSDPITIFAATLFVAVVTVLAGYLPARRATKVDPMVALRYE